MKKGIIFQLRNGISKKGNAWYRVDLDETCVVKDKEATVTGGGSMFVTSKTYAMLKEGMTLNYDETKIINR
jgi:hypothetical protein